MENDGKELIEKRIEMYMYGWIKRMKLLNQEKRIKRDCTFISTKFSFTKYPQEASA